MQFMMSQLVVGSITRTFEIWFFKLFVPAVTGRGKVALIGDNLGSHFSKAVIDKCLEENIYFCMSTTKCNTFL